MAPAKTLYVRDIDMPLWKRFESAVSNWGPADSVSALVAEAMRQYLDQFGDQGGGLYALPPDVIHGAVTFGEGRTALLDRDQQGWRLSVLDEDGDIDDHLIGRCDARAAVAEARRYLGRKMEGRVEEEHDARLEQIEVECEDRTGRTRVERFRGRWLIEPDPTATRAIDADYDVSEWDSGFYWGVALTARGQFAVYSARDNGGRGSLAVYADADALELGPVPPSISRAALGELSGDTPVIDRDI